MLKTCEICHSEFETNNPLKKYCSELCSKEASRHADKLRKRNERKIKRDKQTAEEVERRRLKRAEIEEDAQERARQSQADLEKRLKARDPKAIMEITNHSDLEYWEAYKENFMQDYYNKDYIRYINDISVYDDDFPSKVINSIKEKGSIYSYLVRNNRYL